MTVSVLIVDDSGFFRKRLHEILSSVPEIKVVGAASNGREALDLVKKIQPDVVTMDYEMPVMDGVTAVRHIMAECPTPILMFSSLTYEGARVTLDALEAGAVDFLPKNFEDIARDYGRMQEVLKERILAIANQAGKKKASAVSPNPQPSSAISEKTEGLATTPKAGLTSQAVPTQANEKKQPKSIASSHKQAPEVSNKQSISSSVKPVKAEKIKHPVDILLIGASTGGPIAIQKVLSKLPANFPMPILVVQHMPEGFTASFAKRLNEILSKRGKK